MNAFDDVVLILDDNSTYASNRSLSYEQVVGASGGKSFKCSSNELMVTDMAKMQLSNYRVIAFKNDSNTDFSQSSG